MNIAHKILFIDDEPYILKSLERVFEDEGYEIIMAESAFAAIEILKKTPVTVNPNPVHQTALISIQNAENEYWLLEVFNAAGTVVRRFPINGSQFLFNRDGLTPGLYLMKLTSNQRSFVVKLLVE